MGLLGILIGLALLVGLAYRGWSVLGLAPHEVAGQRRRITL